MGMPKRLLGNSANALSTGVYNPAPPMEAAMTLAGVGAPAAEAGAAGIFGGKLAKTADLRALQEAEQMRMAGKHPADVWNDTGWMRSPMDSKWRFEIPDNKMALRTMPAVEGNTARGKVSTLVSHPELAKAYPEIQSQGMWIAKDSRSPTGSGGYNPIHDDLKGFLQPYSEINAPNMSVGRSVGAHELQHAVQDIEGFTFGGNPSQYAHILEQEGRKAGHGYDHSELAKKADDFYKRTAGEVEARNVQKRLDYSPIERAAIPPWETQDVPFNKQLLIEALKDYK